MKLLGLILGVVICFNNVYASSGWFEGLVGEGERFLARWFRKRILRDLREVAEFEEDLEVFVDLLLQGPVVRTLVQEQPITILAPMEDAFENISMAPFAYYYNTDILRQLLLYHMVPGTFDSETLEEAQNTNVVNVYGDILKLASNNSEITVETVSGVSAQAVEVDFELGESSVLHAIDSILKPPNFPLETLTDVAEEFGLTELLNALRIADISDYIETFSRRGVTLFAPTNQAFMQLARKMNVTLDGEEFYTTKLAENIPEKDFEDLLLNHFVVGVLKTEDLRIKAQDSCEKWGTPQWLCSLLKDVRTLAFGSVRFRSDEQVLKVLYGQDFQESATLLSTDVRALNGVAYIVDAVIA